ncbi:DUF2235 domain-containing protein [Flavobacterium sp.]|uniref:T6SS phospholipase effector Tle1-like catalytic domain-containing protein n=1 Tax=Flavobacterium sp. TaxID=239 RepID=UPI00286D40F4|nr:DUF2235 domain-containing protein [Flavobacterium sp.]
MAEETSGIVRMIGGDMVNTSTEMKLTATDGNYEIHSPAKIQISGEENGVVYGDYKADHKEDTLSNSINVNLNIFFDGTGNNKTNTESRDINSPNHEAYKDIGNQFDDSFENDYTNVARGFDAVDPNVENQVRVYVEGMGTEDLKKDNSIPGVAFGKGDTGVPAKVTKGCLYAGNMMAEKGYAGKDIDYLFVNVYGFSRGAAAARHFLHVASKMAEYSSPQKVDDKISKYYIKTDYRFYDKDLVETHQFELKLENTAFIDKYGYFGACLLKNKINPKFIIFNFVGLYDCVASYGMGHDKNTEQLNLNSISKAKFIYHLASDDEYRKNFPLTNINSCGVKGIEFILPGVHSDIGGSYLDNNKEMSAVDSLVTYSGEESKKMAQESKDKDFDAFKKILVSEGWFTETQIQKEFFKEKEFIGFFTRAANQYIYGLVGRRTLSNSYDKIPLHLMVNQSKHFKVKYDESILKTLAINDKFIKDIQNDIHHYVNACINKRGEYIDSIEKGTGSLESFATSYISDVKQLHYKNFMELADLKKLRNKYLHWSVKSNFVGLGPKNSGSLKEELRKRHTYHG